MSPSPLRPDADTPPDGDFASYVERLTRQPHTPTPGAMPPRGSAKQAARRGAALATPRSFWQRVWHALQQASQASQSRK